jgi:hypothetical protein
MTQEERQKWDMELTRPVKGAKDHMSAEDEMAQLKYL